MLIADDHPVVRKGIRHLLETEPGIELVGEAANGREAVRKFVDVKPDVVLLDLVMPELDGIGAIRAIKMADDHARILVLTTFASEDMLFPAIQAGALGYLLKDTEPEDLVQAIKRVHSGEISLSPAIAQKVLGEISRRSDRPLTTDPLTGREVEVLGLLARGLANRQIAGQLVISEATVRTHVGNILSKLHLASRTQAALYALREGLASLYGTDD